MGLPIQVSSLTFMERCHRPTESKVHYLSLMEGCHKPADPRFYENGHNFFVRTPNEVKRSALGEYQVGDKKEQSARCRTVPRCIAITPKVTELEDAEGQSKKAMELTIGRIAKWIGDPDLLRRMVLRITFFGDYKYMSEFLV
uniref:Uncharacterized protein n=1 Tax=Solanum tuberosum TaxID=4113 RepID=M1DN65_SOLTU